jgi:hypothetical protein
MPSHPTKTFHVQDDIPTPIPILGILQKKSSKSGKFSPPKITHSNHHNSPSIHHKLTTNSPSKNTTFSRTPLKNPSKNHELPFPKKSQKQIPRR